jgi:hypothetical protein
MTWPAEAAGPSLLTERSCHSLLPCAFAVRRHRSSSHAVQGYATARAAVSRIRSARGVQHVSEHPTRLTAAGNIAPPERVVQS